MLAAAALPAALLAFGHEVSGRVGLGRLAPVLRPRRWTRGPPGQLLWRATALARFSGEASSTVEHHTRPRRLRVRYERAGRSFYSAAAAVGAKMTRPIFGGRPAGGPRRPQRPISPPESAEGGSQAA